MLPDANSSLRSLCRTLNLVNLLSMLQSGVKPRAAFSPCGPRAVHTHQITALHGKQAWLDTVSSQIISKVDRLETSAGRRSETRLAATDVGSEVTDFPKQGVGTGPNKQMAEKAAAWELIKKLTKAFGTNKIKQMGVERFAQSHGMTSTYETIAAREDVWVCTVRLHEDLDLPSPEAAAEEKENTLAADVVKIALSSKQEQLLQAALEGGLALSASEHAHDKPDTTSRVEKRIDSDGGSYTQEEFQAYYGSTWQQRWDACKAVELVQQEQLLRRASVPPQARSSSGLKSVREALPAFEARAQILQIISDNQVIIIQGETGCGKTTQVGQFIMEEAAERRVPCSVVCTQPRRISAIGVAERVADERGELVGGSVGYSVRHEKAIGSQTHLLFCTVGILLRRLEINPDLEGTTHVLVDEVHERSIESDFLLLALRDLAKRRSDLKIVLMSATLDQDLFSRYFGGAPSIVIPGRTFPVQEFFLEDALQITNHVVDPNAEWSLNPNAEVFDPKKREDLDRSRVATTYKAYGQEVRTALSGIEQDAINYDLIASLIQGSKLQELAREGQSLGAEEADARPDGVLVFLSGAREIQTLQSALLDTPEFGQEPARSWILPLHGSLPSEDQKKAFLHPPQGVRKIVLSTNVAETSITIPDIGYVVDSCRMKEMRYDPASKISSLVDTVVSRTNARQRRGRAGRVAPGIAVHVGLTRLRHDDLVDDHQPPEVQRVSLEQLILQIYAIGLHMRDGSGKAANVCVDLLEPPEPLRVQKTVAELVSLGAVEVNETSGHESLTIQGKHLASLPMDVRLGKLVLFGTAFGAAATDAAITIAAALTSRSPFLISWEERYQSEAAKERFAKKMRTGSMGLSDHLAAYAAYNEWDQLPLSGNERLEFCQRNYLSSKTLSIMSDMKRSLLETLSQAGLVKRGVRAHDVALLGQRTGRDGVLKALSKVPLRPCPPTLVAALLVAALFPQLAKVSWVQPKKRAAGSAGQSQLRPMFSVKDAETGEQVHVKMTRGNVCADESALGSPLLIYQELYQTTASLYVRDVTPVPPLALALFAGRLDVAADEETEGTRVMIIDDWIKLEMSRSTCDLLLQIRRYLDAFWYRWMRRDGEDDVRDNLLMEQGGSRLLTYILASLNAQEDL